MVVSLGWLYGEGNTAKGLLAIGAKIKVEFIQEHDNQSPKIPCRQQSVCVCLQCKFLCMLVCSHGDILIGSPEVSASAGAFDHFLDYPLHSVPVVMR